MGLISYTSFKENSIFIVFAEKSDLQIHSQGSPKNTNCSHFLNKALSSKQILFTHVRTLCPFGKSTYQSNYNSLNNIYIHTVFSSLAHIN